MEFSKIIKKVEKASCQFIQFPNQEIGVTLREAHYPGDGRHFHFEFDVIANDLKDAAKELTEYLKA